MNAIARLQGPSHRAFFILSMLIPTTILWANLAFVSIGMNGRDGICLATIQRNSLVLAWAIATAANFNTIACKCDAHCFPSIASIASFKPTPKIALYSRIASILCPFAK